MVVPPPSRLSVRDVRRCRLNSRAVQAIFRARGSVLILNGTVVSESGQTKADLRIEDGTIVALGPAICESLEPIKLSMQLGLYVLPGVIDPHVHF